MSSTQKTFNQNSFDEGFRFDNPGLARLSYVIVIVTSFRIVDLNDQGQDM